MRALSSNDEKQPVWIFSFSILVESVPAGCRTQATSKGMHTMEELKQRIVQEGTVKEGNVLKVDAFLNHQCDVELFDHMGAEWARLFADKQVDKILTIEASGIGIAAIVAQHFWRAGGVCQKVHEHQPGLRQL